MRWPGAPGRRGQEPTDRTLPISTGNLPVSVSHDIDFGATSFHQTKMAAPGAKAPMTMVLSELRAFQARRQADSEAGPGLGDQLRHQG